MCPGLLPPVLGRKGLRPPVFERKSSSIEIRRGKPLEGSAILGNCRGRLAGILQIPSPVGWCESRGFLAQRRCPVKDVKAWIHLDPPHRKRGNQLQPTSRPITPHHPP